VINSLEKSRVINSLELETATTSGTWVSTDDGCVDSLAII
jgi:hypothetical protein